MNGTIAIAMAGGCGTAAPLWRTTDALLPRMPITQAAAGSPAANYVSLERTFRGAMRGVTTGAR